MGESKEARKIKQEIVRLLNACYGTALMDYNHNGHEHDIYSQGNRDKAIIVEVIWSSSKYLYLYDTRNLLMCNAPIQIAVVGPGVKEKHQRDFNKVKLRLEDRGTVVSDMFDGTLFLNNPDRAMSEFTKLVRNLTSAKIPYPSYPKDYKPIVMPFDPFQYYSQEIDKFIFLRTINNRRIPHEEIFRYSEGLTETELECKLLGEFELPRNLVSFNKTIIGYIKSCGHRIWDDYVARLYKIKVGKRQKPKLYFQRGLYLNSFGTNSYLDLKFPGWDTRMRDIVAPSSSPCPLLQQSMQGNNLGLSCLIEDEQGGIVLQKRSKEVAVYQFALGPSASGVMTLLDSIDAKGRISPFRGIRNEIATELGMEIEKKVKDLKLVGITRELERGRKPEAFFVSKINIDSKEMLEIFGNKATTPEDPWEYFHLESSNSMQKLFSEQEERISPPLMANLYYYDLFRHRGAR